jgi:hypothetical protein
VDVGEPIETSGMTVDDRDALIADVRARIEAMLSARRRPAELKCGPTTARSRD